MNTKLLISGIVGAGLSLTLCACSMQTNASEETSNIPQVNLPAAPGEKQGELEQKIKVLGDKEQAVFDSHKTVWEKLFAKIDKTFIMQNPDFTYAKQLSKTLEDNRADFSKDEQEILEADIKKIEEFDKELEPLLKEQAKQGQTKDSAQVSIDTQKQAYPSFIAKDFEGNALDSSYFKKNAVTVVNYWYNNCAPCVAEIPALQKLNEDIKQRGGEVIGINTETFDGKKETRDEALRILKEQGANYKQIIFDKDTEAYKHASECFTFPSTYLVDRQGNIIGEPILGGLSNKDAYDKLLKRIDQIIKTDSKDS